MSVVNLGMPAAPPPPLAPRRQSRQIMVGSVPVGGGTPRLLVRFDDPAREWHRFGFKTRRGRFYFTVGDRQSDLWMADVEDPKH